MALENISNLPDVCSGMLRIAPRPLQIINFLAGGPPTPPPPPRTFPPSRTFCHLTPPPPGKNPGSAPVILFGYVCIMLYLFH